MSAFTVFSLDDYISWSIKAEWMRKYATEEDAAILPLINNPIDWCEYITCKLLQSSVSVVYMENGYILDDGIIDDIIADSNDDVMLCRQLQEFKAKTKNYDVYIDTKDFAKMIGYSNIKDATETITGYVPNAHQKKLSDFGNVPTQQSNPSIGQLTATSKNGIIDPNQRAAREIQHTRSYFHIEALPDVLQRISQAQAKTTKHGTNSYDVSQFMGYVKRVMDFNRVIGKTIAIRMTQYISKHNKGTIAGLQQSMELSMRMADQRHEAVMKCFESARIHAQTSQQSVKRLETKIDKIAENQKNPRSLILYRNKSWQTGFVKLVGGLCSDQRFREIRNNTEKYEIIFESGYENNAAKSKTDLVKSYKKRGLVRMVTIKEGDQTTNTLNMSSDVLKLFIKELQSTDKKYTISDDNEEEDDTTSAVSIVTINYVVYLRSPTKNEKTNRYPAYLGFFDKSGYEDTRFHKKEIPVYNKTKEILKTICDGLNLTYDEIEDSIDDSEWHEFSINTRGFDKKIIDFIKQMA